VGVVVNGDALLITRTAVAGFEAHLSLDARPR
jgi:hypothetical protein